MTNHSAIMARRKMLFGRTLVLTALFVVAAASSVLCVRSARADVPIAPPKEDAPAEAQVVASLLVAQSIGNPVLGASFQQVLWGGGVKPVPPKGDDLTQSGAGAANQTPGRFVPSRTEPRTRKAASAKSG